MIYRNTEWCIVVKIYIPPLAFSGPMYYRGRGLEESFLFRVSFNLGGVHNYFCTTAEKDVSYEGGIFCIYNPSCPHLSPSPHCSLSLSFIHMHLPPRSALTRSSFLAPSTLLVLRLLKSQATHVVFFNHFNN